MKRIRTRSAAALLAAQAAFATAALAQNDTTPDATMIRHPDVSRDKIVFGYANDLWTVDRAGGVATPLSSPAGSESFARFSPDGSRVAFSGNYEGGTDVYIVPTNGGPAERLTYHPTGERVLDFTDAGILFVSDAQVPNSRQDHLWVVSPDGGMPELLPIPYGANGAISGDGKWVAYTPGTREFRSWKRYEGGMQDEIYLFNLETMEARRATDWRGTDTSPMWHGGKLYYLSDQTDRPERDVRMNIWSYDPETERREQVTNFTDFDVKFPAMGPGPNGQGEIVFHAGPSLYLLDLRTERVREVEVRIPGDTPRLRRQIEDVSRSLSIGSLSPNAKRAAASARGDIWTAPAENGTPRNLTGTDGAADRYPSWSPDGRWIAYISDQDGEYEVWITQSDGAMEPQQITDGNETFFYQPQWSPDGKRLLLSDNDGRLYAVDLGEPDADGVFGMKDAVEIDKDPAGGGLGVSFSHDSRWITYSRAFTDERGNDVDNNAVFVVDLDSEDRDPVRLTSGYYSDGSPTFDRKGDYIFYVSQRQFRPSYSSFDNTWIYDDSARLMAAPLRSDLDYPYLPEVDEQDWETASSDDDEDDGSPEDASGEGDASEDAGAEDEGDGGGEDGQAAADPISGAWSGTLDVPEMGGVPVSMTLTLSGNAVTGEISVMDMGLPIEEGTFDRGTGILQFTVNAPQGAARFRCEVSGDSMSGSAVVEGATITLDASRSSAGGGGQSDGGGGEDVSDEAAETVEIETEGFERRAFELAPPAGNFGNLAVNNRNQLLYARRGQNGGIKLFDLSDDSRSEKSVTGGAGSFIMNADGTKLLTTDGRVFNASAGASGSRVVTSPMTVTIEPREEWRQVVTDAWRRFRDFFYVENMHGVDWDAVRERYVAMVDHAGSREDIGYIIREMLGELNVGHAYYRPGPTQESGRSRNTGLLGVDLEVAEDEAGNEGVRVTRILRGSPHDSEDDSPFARQGVEAEEGDFIVAINGNAVPTDRGIWSMLGDLAGETISVTLSEDAVRGGDDDRTVVVETMRSERETRLQEWIEDNRQKVLEMSDGQIGYIYVRSTGVPGQTDLVRQFMAQRHLPALLIDERWNSGGQIPDRFIELLNRPVTNYWRRRDARDWRWPPVAHNGPKAMLINGWSGSGGDMFPWLFKHEGLGELIGMRTWGGLVGISGVPGMIDGSGVSVPNFGFYETDGTWGIEGYGVPPDVEVWDDPSELARGNDPQLEAGVRHLLRKLETERYERPEPPADPDRSGFGLSDDRDR